MRKFEYICFEQEDAVYTCLVFDRRALAPSSSSSSSSSLPSGGELLRVPVREVRVEVKVAGSHLEVCPKNFDKSFQWPKTKTVSPVVSQRGGGNGRGRRAASSFPANKTSVLFWRVGDKNKRDLTLEGLLRKTWPSPGQRAGKREETRRELRCFGQKKGENHSCARFRVSMERL